MIMRSRRLQKKEKEWHKIFSFSYQYLKELRFQFIGILVILAVGSIVSSVSPYIWGKIIDKIAAGQVNQLLFWIALYLVVTFFTLGLSFLEGYWGSKLNYIAESKLKQKLMKKALYLNCKDLDSFDTGVLISRISSDTGEVISFVFEVITSIVTISVNIIAATFFVFRISIPLSVISIAFIPLSIFSNVIFKKSYKTLSKLQKDFGDRLSSFNVGTLGHISEIKAYCLEKEQTDKYDSFIDEGWSLEKKQLFLGNKTSLVSSFINLSSVISILVLSAHLIAKGTFTLGGMTSFQRYISKLTGAVSSLLQMNYSAQSALVAVDRMTELFSLKDEMEEDGVPGVAQKFSKISFQNVSFQYKEGCEVLNGISFCIDSPGIYALVGENGCGKSTALKLIMRYYEASSGKILLDDTPIEEIPLATLRRSIGFYPKDVYIQDGTLLENLMLGSRRNSQFQDTNILEQACECVGLSDFIRELPEGLATKVGENGKLLSSGQKQRIAIVRAILDESSVLLFDEITSDLDGDAEKNIMEIIRDLSKTKTILMVTHRSQSVLFSKCTMVLANGEIVAHGNHQELLENSAKYQDLFERQSV